MYVLRVVVVGEKLINVSTTLMNDREFGSPISSKVNKTNVNL